ncbi:myosin heavy chain [Acrasis kona]|uniref:Myosin heavy chain n=1 Tax=Acrasis kona TaxID=1008807 RepID=A0AAW2Z9Z8_9EUKA
MSDDPNVEEQSQGTRRTRRTRKATTTEGSDSPADVDASQPGSATFYGKLLDARNDSSAWKSMGANYMWVPDDEEGYVVGEILSREGEDAEIQTESGQKRKVKLVDVHPMNPPNLNGVNDMARLSHLNEPSVLANLRERYSKDNIYTYSGLFLIAVNPYKSLPIYTKEVMDEHQGRRREDAEPHIYTISDNAYRQMLTNKMNQSMLVTGESGAGKTENTKKVIQYLTHVAGEGGGGGKLEQQLIRTNPLLEAFGNAKTSRNNNSSRFGKFIEIDFNASGYIAGTKIQHYLLETNRVTGQAEGERNFHFFYQLCSNEEARKKYNLQTAEDYFYLNQSHCTVVAGIDDRKEFTETLTAMKIINIHDDEIDSLCRVGAAILHLGNIEFTQNQRSESSIPDDKVIAAACNLLEVNQKALTKAFCTPTITVNMTEKIVTNATAAQAGFNRNSLVKSMYLRMFDWLVRRVNQTLAAKQTIKNFIGVLDIAGFEIFGDNNFFDQLCINFTNEKLQQFFNHHMFKREQEEYMREKIEWKYIDFGLDLQPTIDLIEKPLGLFAILDQMSMMSAVTEEGYVEECKRNQKGSKVFAPHRFNKLMFTVQHYAGAVNYNAVNWLSKNIDPLNEDSKATMLDSKNVLIKTLFQTSSISSKGSGGGQPSRGVSSARFNTVASNYKSQLKELMDVLESTEPHFIRCIVPNSLQKPGIINAALVLHQLKCNGVLEGIRISRKGYPGRIKYTDFVSRYELLGDKKAMNAEATQKGKARAILDTIQFVETKQYKLGSTKCFLRAGQEALIEELRERRIAQIIISAQAALRGALARKQFKDFLAQIAGVIKIQKNWRAFLLLRNWGWWQLFSKARGFIDTDKQEKEMARAKKDLDDLKNKIESEAAARRLVEQEREALQNQIRQKEADAEAQKSRMEDLQKQLAGQRDELQEKLDQLERKQRDLSQRDNNIAQLQAVIQETQSKLNSKQKDIEDLQDDMNDIKNALNGKSSESGVKDVEISSLKKKQKALEEQLKEQQGKFDNEHNELLANQQLQKTLDERLREVRYQLEQEAKTRQERDAKVKDLEGKYKETDKELKNQRSENEKAQAELQRLNSQKNATEEDLAAKAKDLEELNRKLRGNENALADTNRRLDEETRKKQAAETKNRHLQGDLTEAQSNIEQLKEQASSLEDLVKALRDEILQLKARIAELEDANASLTKKRDDLDRELKELRLTSTDEINKLKAELERSNRRFDDSVRDAQDALDRQNNEKNQVDSKYRKTDSDLKKLRREYETLQKTKEEVDIKGRKLETDLNEANTNQDLLRRQIQDFESQIRDLDNQNKDLEQTRDSEREEAQRQLAKYNQLKSQLTSEKERANQAESDKDDLAANKISQESQIRNLQAELSAERDAAAKLKGELDYLRRQLEELNSKSESLSGDKSKLENERRVNQEKINELNQEIENEKLNVSNLERKRKQLESDNKKQQQVYQEEQIKNKELQAKISQLEVKSRESESQLNVSRDANNDVSRQLKTLQQELEQLKGQLSDSDSNLQKAKNDAKEKQRQIEELEEARDEAQSGQDALEQQLAEVNARIVELTSRLTTEQQLKSQLESDSQRLKSENDKLRQESGGNSKQLQSQIENLKLQLDQLESDNQREIKKLTDERNELKREYKTLQRDLSQPKQTGVDSEELERVKRDYEDSESKKRSAELQLADLKEKLLLEERQRKKIDSQKKQLQSEVDDLRELAEESEDLREELSALKLDSESSISKLRDEILKERSSRVTAEEGLIRYKRESEDLASELDLEKNKLDDAVRKVRQQFENEISELDNLVAQAKKSKSNAKRDVKKFERDLRDLQRQVQDEVRLRNEAESRATGAEREYKQLQSKSESQQVQLSRLESDKLRLESEANSYKNRAQDLEDDINRLREEVDRERKKRNLMSRKMNSVFRGGSNADDDDE